MTGNLLSLAPALFLLVFKRHALKTPVQTMQESAAPGKK